LAAGFLAVAAGFAALDLTGFAAGFLAAVFLAVPVAAVPAVLRVAIFMLLEVGRKRPPI
jgi:hypothetical protein